MAIYLPQGGIELNQQVILGYWDGGNLFALVDTTGDETKINSNYCFERATLQDMPYATLAQNTVKRAAVFELQGTRDALQLQELKPYSGAWLSGEQNGGEMYIAARSTERVSLLLLQSAYQEWNDPVVLLAGVRYQVWTIEEDGSNLLVNFAIREQSGEITGWSSSCIAMPLSYYYGCGSGGCYFTEQVNDTLLLSYCSLLGIVGVESCTFVEGPGWTDADDAVTAHVYNYCTAGKNCQTNCKAPCPESNQECLYNGDTFICKATLNSLFSGEWWKETWFIIVVVGVLLLLLSVLIAAIYSRRQKKNEEGGSGTNQGRKYEGVQPTSPSSER